jgi:mannan endo-1,4-beta-mannosidase
MKPNRFHSLYIIGLGAILIVILSLNLAGYSASDSFVTRENDGFRIDGQPFYVAGTNNHYVHYAPKSEVDRVLADAAGMKLNVMRVFAFVDIGSPDQAVATAWNSYGPTAYDLNTNGVYFQYWDTASQKPAYNDGANGLQRLDYLIARAGQVGLKLIVVLTNNWQHLGGMPQYMTWYYLERQSDFYVNQQAKEAYKNWVTHIVTRENTVTKKAYRDDPTIMAWELANEPHCDNVDTQVLTDWIAEMSGHIKRLDPNHLIGVGDEGFFNWKDGTGSAYNGSSGLDFEANLKVATIDFGTYHLYPDWWKTTPEWGVQYIKDHLTAGKAIGKPVVLEEFGWQNDATKEKVYGMWLEAIYKENGAGWMFWRLVAPSENGTRPKDSDHFDIYYPSGLATSLANWAQLFTQRNSAAANGPSATIAPAPSEFSLTYPAGGKAAVSVSPTFSWQSAAGATGYEIIVATDGAFENRVYNTVIPDTKFTPVTPLSHETTYYWKVTALNDNGSRAAENSPISFTTEKIPRANIIDDFENYDGSAYALNAMYKRNPSGNIVKVSFDSVNKNDGKYGLKYEYTLTEPGWCGVIKQKLRNTNWQGAVGIQLWLKSDGSDNYFTIQFQETNGEAWEYGIKLAGSTEAGIVQFPFEKFYRPDWCKVGDNHLNLRSISNFSIYMGKNEADSSGTLYIDSITLMGDLKPKQ